MGKAFARKVSITMASLLLWGTSTFAIDQKIWLLNNNLRLIEKSSEQHDPGLNDDIDVSYPQIVGNPLPENAVKFNAAMQNIVNNEIKDFKDRVREAINNPEVSADMKTGKDYESNLSISYTAGVLQPNHQILIGVGLESQFSIISYAHPWINLKDLNYNFNSGRTLALSDLFAPNADYRNVIAAACLRYPPELCTAQNIKEAGADQAARILTACKDGLKPDAVVESWYLQPNGITLRFGEYHFALGRGSIDSTQIPFKALASAPLSPLVAICADQPCTVSE